MTSFQATRTIDAAPETVFDTVAHIDTFSKALPHITNVEYLTDQTRGVGTRFRETRLFGKREGKTELEVTEYEPPSKVRLVSDAGGTVWDTVFMVSASDDGTRLAMNMDARPHTFVARLITPLTSRVVRRALERDMDAVKEYCETGSG